MNAPGLSYHYPLRLWIGTVFIAPIIEALLAVAKIGMFTSLGPGFAFAMLLYGWFVTLPGLGLMLLVWNRISKNNYTDTQLKRAAITAFILGLMIMIFFGLYYWGQLILPYGIAAISVGYFLKVDKPIAPEERNYDT